LQKRITIATDYGPVNTRSKHATAIGRFMHNLRFLLRGDFMATIEAAGRGGRMRLAVASRKKCADARITFPLAIRADTTIFFFLFPLTRSFLSHYRRWLRFMDFLPRDRGTRRREGATLSHPSPRASPRCCQSIPTSFAIRKRTSECPLLPFPSALTLDIPPK